MRLVGFDARASLRRTGATQVGAPEHSVRSLLKIHLISDNRNFELWTPATHDHCNAIFWGAAMVAMTLPAAFLAFRKSHADEVTALSDNTPLPFALNHCPVWRE